MKDGDPLNYWGWDKVINGPTLLRLKAGVKPLGIYVRYDVLKRSFHAGITIRTPISPNQIDDRAVAEALAVSLTYEDTS